MLLGLFRSITLFSNKHPYLKYNSLVQNIFPYYQRAKVAIASLDFKPDLQFIADSVRFFSKNADRVRKVADFLTDDRSKIAYLGNIKYRQTFNKQDFPSVGYDSVPYFIKEMNLSSAEVFIDCGACSGETTYDFIRRARGFDKIVIFEPEPVNYEECKKRLKIMKLDNNPNVQLLNTGAYDADGTIYFNTKGGGRGTGTIFAGGGGSPLVAFR